MKVISLNEFGKENFLDELKILNEKNFIGDKRNHSWFNMLLKKYHQKFGEWFFLVDNDELVAFATIQEYYPKCFRLLTRTYIYPKYRRQLLPKYDEVSSPSTYLFLSQIQHIGSYKTIFISMQDLKRRQALYRYSQKLGNGWELHPDMIQTCSSNNSNCWQSVIYKGAELKLPKMTIDEWKFKWQKNV